MVKNFGYFLLFIGSCTYSSESFVRPKKLSLEEIEVKYGLSQLLDEQLIDSEDDSSDEDLEKTSNAVDLESVPLLLSIKVDKRFYPRRDHEFAVLSTLTVIPVINSKTLW